MNTITHLASLLRGATSIDNRGAICLFADTQKATGSVLYFEGSVTDEFFIAEIHKTLHGKKTANNGEDVVPLDIACLDAVVVKNVGTFFVGTSYDDAHAKRCKSLNTKPEYSPDPSTLEGRSAVMSNRISVVTGGAQGFGEGIVRELVAANSLVYIADMNSDGADALAAELNAHYGRTTALAVKVNVTDEESIAEMINVIGKEGGGIDLFVNNAGVLKAASVKEQTLADLNFVTSVNYTGYFLCVKAVAVTMEQMNRAARDGYSTDIIQISSKSGLEGSNKNGSYAGSKFGGIGLTQSFALELVADNTKVNSICPGNFFDGPLWSDPERGLFVQYLKTGKVPGATSVDDVKKFYEAKVPMNRGCSGADVARAIFYAVEQQYETGQAIPVTGGQVMLN